MRNSLICIFLSVLGLLACTEADDLTYRDADGVVVSFTTPGMTTGDVNTRAVSSYVPLDENTTVRILVYRRTGATANMATDTYIGENTYVANAYGALLACKVDANGKVIAGTATDLRLIQGKYDFYAITPALPVTPEAADNTRKVSVNHGVDYATSLTQQGEITTTSGAVTLDVLDRKCSKLEFAFDRKSTNVSKIDIEEVELANMSNAPLVGVLAQNLPDASAWTTKIKVNGGTFKVTDAAQPWKATGDTILLPKPAGDFTLGMKLKFNGFTNVITLTPATISGLAFAQGYRYLFKVTLKGGTIQLTLTVANWSETYNVSADDLGASNSVTINVGEWNNVDFNSSTGGSDNVTIGNWTGSVDWDDAMGEYPELSGTTIDGSALWGGGNNSDSSTGGKDDVDNGNWGNSSDTNPGGIGA